MAASEQLMQLQIGKSYTRTSMKIFQKQVLWLESNERVVISRNRKIFRLKKLLLYGNSFWFRRVVKRNVRVISHWILMIIIAAIASSHSSSRLSWGYPSKDWLAGTRNYIFPKSIILTVILIYLIRYNRQIYNIMSVF